MKNYIVDILKLYRIKPDKVYYNNEHDVAILLKNGTIKVFAGGKLIELSTLPTNINELAVPDVTLYDLPIEQLNDLLVFYESEADYIKCAEIRDIIKSKYNAERTN